MNEYFFGLGLGPGHLPNKADEIAKLHDAWLVNYTEPNGYKRHWFACRNMGDPYNRSTADAVFADLESAGVLESGAA